MTTQTVLRPPARHLVMTLTRWAEQDPGRPVAGRREGETVIWTTAADLERRARALAKGLIASGVAAGDRVALQCRTRLEWPVVDYAILMAGAVTVPVYDTSAPDQVRWIATDSGAVLAVAETAEQGAVWLEAAAPGLGEVLIIDTGGLDTLAERGTTVPDTAVDARLAGLGPASLATIVYTSGTTGRPKGCMLTHGNLCANVAQGLDAARTMLHAEETNLLFLPLAHALARIIWLVGFEQGVRTVFCPDLARLPEDLAVVRPTMMVAVPRVFEKLYHRARHTAVASHRGMAFDRAAKVAERWAAGPLRAWARPVLWVEHALWDRLVYRKLRAAMGGRLGFAVSGGGPLGARLTLFYAGAGLSLYEGYGLTEASPVLTLNRADDWKPGTVGKVVEGTTARIEPDGEILVRGPQIFQGYWQAPEATAETLTPDGWLRTGDIGHFDADGFLCITGRKKDLIVTSGGKNVAPAPLEERLQASPLIAQAVVLGDNRPYVTALVSLDPDSLSDWRAEHPSAGDDPAADPQLLAELQAAVDVANAPVSKAEGIRRFAVIPHELTVAAGELTPTLKVRRAQVQEHYGELIEGLYS